MIVEYIKTLNSKWEMYFKIIPKLIGIWFLLVLINYALKKMGFIFNTPLYFPISILELRFNLYSIPFAVLFLLTLFFYTRIDFQKMNILKIFVLGFLFVVFGNLIQGGFKEAFIDPVYGSGVNYYSDAININEWKTWLANFTNLQPSLHVHSKTHPAGAVLVHYFLVLGDSPVLMSIIFSILSSLSILLVYRIFIDLGKSVLFALSISLLYSLIPAFNIYSIVSIDGLISTLMTLSLWGIIRIKTLGLSIFNVLILIIGIVTSSMLTFGTLFLWAVLFILVILDVRKKQYSLLCTLLMSTLIFLFLILYLYKIFNYNYIESFVIASKIENQGGFLLFHNPIEYIMTRIENISEILLFLSFGVLSVFYKKRSFSKNIPTDISQISYVAICTLITIWLTGAYRTGETARACLFIYPYLLMLLCNISIPMLRNLSIIAGLQTFFMHLFGNYIW